MKPNRWYKAYFFDIDGTLALGNDIVPGVLECLRRLREEKVVVRFLSNESTTDKEGHVRRLRKLGIDCTEDEVITTIEASCAWIEANYPTATVFAIGAPDLKNALKKRAILTSNDPSQVDIVLASCDKHVEYGDLQVGFSALWQYKKGFLMATNPDRRGLLPGGAASPDTAFVIAALEASAGVKCQVVVGKPNPHFLLGGLAGTNISPADVLMVGDTMETDIAVAHNAGTASALVLTGDSTLAEAADAGPGKRPTWVVDNLMDLIPSTQD